MKIIAHRGLINGPNLELENRPDTILKALYEGFDVEIDLHIKDGKPWLGHDEPTYPVTHHFLYQSHYSKLWIHAKTLEAAAYCSGMLSNTKWFFHQNDDCTIVSGRYIWTFPNASLPLYKNSIAVLPELVYNDKEIFSLDCYGICTDFANKYRAMLR